MHKNLLGPSTSNLFPLLLLLLLPCLLVPPTRARAEETQDIRDGVEGGGVGTGRGGGEEWEKSIQWRLQQNIRSFDYAALHGITTPQEEGQVEKEEEEEEEKLVERRGESVEARRIPLLQQPRHRDPNGDNNQGESSDQHNQKTGLPLASKQTDLDQGDDGRLVIDHVVRDRSDIDHVVRDRSDIDHVVRDRSDIDHGVHDRSDIHHGVHDRPVTENDAYDRPVVDHGAYDPSDIDQSVHDRPVVENGADDRANIDHGTNDRPVSDHGGYDRPVIDHMNSWKDNWMAAMLMTGADTEARRQEDDDEGGTISFRQHSFGLLNACEDAMCDQILRQAHGLSRMKKIRSFVRDSLSQLDMMVTGMEGELIQTGSELSRYLGSACRSAQLVLQGVIKNTVDIDREPNIPRNYARGRPNQENNFLQYIHAINNAG